MRYLLISSDAKFTLADYPSSALPANLVAALGGTEHDLYGATPSPQRPRIAVPDGVDAYMLPAWMPSCEDPICPVFTEFVSHVGHFVGAVRVH